jgi:hypothetical protein
LIGRTQARGAVLSRDADQIVGIPYTDPETQPRRRGSEGTLAGDAASEIEKAHATRCIGEAFASATFVMLIRNAGARIRSRGPW